MGRRGSKPTPTALRVLRGRAPYNTREPKHPPLDAADVPDEIAANKIARAEWERIAPALVAVGQVQITDRAALIAYCVKWARWRECAAIADAEPVMIRGERGDVVHPVRRLELQTYLAFLRAAAEIGLTPSSRSRIIAGTPSVPVSKWSGVLK